MDRRVLLYDASHSGDDLPQAGPKSIIIRSKVNSLPRIPCPGSQGDVDDEEESHAE